MFANLPTTRIVDLTWADLEPFYRELAARPLSADNLEAWLGDWSRLAERGDELYNRLQVATTLHTDDMAAAERYRGFLEETYPRLAAAEHGLKTRLLESGLTAPGFEEPLRRMRAEASLFREANLPLLAEEQKLVKEYDRIVGAETVSVDGKELTLTQLRLREQNPDPSEREDAWRLGMARRLEDRRAINDLWQQFLRLRLRIAANAGMDSYRAYRWQAMMRFDYTPADALAFHQAIEQVAVPAASRIYERRRLNLGQVALRPWDLEVDPLGRPPLRPFMYISALKAKASAIFHHVDKALGDDYDIMALENLLDLENRKNKAPGGYCAMFAVERRPFIFMNAAGTHGDVQTLLHESGHAFHVFESAHLPYFQQLAVGNEFSEVASMGMELLASPYLGWESGGFYDEADAARARREHLESLILFWPYMAVVDAFQHWVYQNPGQAQDPANCDAEWGRLWMRFMPGVSWEGLEDEMVTGWHRKLHIHTSPFYYVEYGLAQLGAVQIWGNSLKDPAGAVAAYRKALSLGGTVPLPQLFETAGARLAFDGGTLGEAVGLIESELARLAD